MEPYEDRREKSSEERCMEEEELRELQEKREKMEQELLYDEARRRLRRKLKYRFVLSNDGMLFLLVVGGAIAFALFRMGIVEKLFRKHEAASRSFGIMLGLLAFMAIWLLFSLIMRIFLKKEALALVASGELTMDQVLYTYEDHNLFKPKKKKSSEIKMEFPIEDFEFLPELDFDLAEEEWDRLDRIVTDQFFRMPSFIHSMDGRAVYRVFIELRYDDAYPNYRLLKKTWEEIQASLKKSCIGADMQMSEFKERAKEIVRERMAQSFPYLNIREICIAVKQIA
ncbi:MAG: hypothetical protein E7295_06015 [Lachnospiraceae bacterium]|nr:hypothetical protein [Lachnospiraceae bacterium]